MKFTRNKLIGVYREGPDTLVAHGILEDDIYGLEVEVTVNMTDLEIKAVGGRWKRAENSECVRGIPFLQEAVGFRMDEEFTQRVQKVIGRKVCRHFADILLEACYAARDAALLIDRERGDIPKTAASSPAHLVVSDRKPFQTREAPSFPDAEPQGSGGMVIDLHAHTFPASPCSSVTVEELIEEGRAIGLDGLCLTDHNHVWDQRIVARLRDQYNFLVLRGNEITTDQGDMVVFGLEKEIRGVMALEELNREVSRAGGFIIVAHPFRGFLIFGIGKLGLTPEKAMERPLFKMVDAVEVLNSKVTEQENAFAAQVAAGLHLPATGGSDAHVASALGIYATRFRQEIKDERGLIRALKSGNYAPIAFRRERKEGKVAHGKTN
jgi:predicted metal-dependent phosphoesterase TrpH